MRRKGKMEEKWKTEGRKRRKITKNEASNEIVPAVKLPGSHKRWNGSF